MISFAKGARCALLLTAFSAALALPSIGVADDTADVETVESQAKAYFRAGAFAEAGDEFARAYEMASEAKYLFNAGLAYEKADLLDKASEMFGRFVDAQPTGDKAIEARARKAAIDGKLKKAAGNGTETPAESTPAAVTEPANPEEPKALDPLKTEIADASNAGPADDSDMASDVSLTSSDTSTPSSNTLAYVSLGVGVAALAAGTYFSFATISKRDDALDPNIGACTDDFSFCNETGIDLHGDARTYSKVAVAGLGIGVGAIGLSAYLWLSRDKSNGKSTLAVAPSVGPSQVGMGMTYAY